MTEKDLSAEHYNIALLHYSCPPVIGGVEMVVSQQASLFHSYFHKVTIFAGAGEPLTAGIQWKSMACWDPATRT